MNSPTFAFVLLFILAVLLAVIYLHLGGSK